MDRNRLIVMGLAGATLLVILIVMIAQLAKPPMALLYSGLDLAEAGKVSRSLEQMGISVDVRDGGTTLFVPQPSVARARMALAEEGLPSSGAMGYELFDQQGSLGLTSFMQQINRLRALEGELARTITALRDVDAARVHLVLPDRDAFTREQITPSASVVVRMRGNFALEKAQASAIQSLVSASVPRLNSSAVTVMDSRGNKIFANDGSDMAGAATGMKAEAELALIRSVESLLAPRLGAQNVRVQAAVEFARNRSRLREQTFDPSATAVRSTQSVEEAEINREGSNEQPVTVEQNLPQVVVGAENAASDLNNSERSEQVTNYEISSRVFEQSTEPGGINRQSVGVLVNGIYQTDEAGNQVYVPRSAEELARIENLVKSAIGFDASRGDQVTVENLEFIDIASTAFPPQGSALMAFVQSNLMSILRYLVLLVAIALVSIFGLRPLITSLANREGNNENRLAIAGAQGRSSEQGGDGDLALEPGADGEQARLDGPDDAAASGARALPKPSVDERLDQMLEVRAVEGKVRASSLRKLGDIVEDNPDEVVAILRSWIYEDAA